MTNRNHKPQLKPWVFVQGKYAFRFEPDEHASLLEAMEYYKIPTHHECRSGYCGACRTSILEGQVEYDHKPLAFIRKGEILPCCCKPVTDLTLDSE